MDANRIKGRIRLSNIVDPKADARELRLLEQLGVHYAYTWCDRLSERYDEIARLMERLSAHGITLNNIGDYTIAKSSNIHLATPERDRDIERFIRMMETIHRLNIGVTTFTWEPDQVWSSSMDYPTRGGARTRHVDTDALAREGLTHGRVYEKEELWENFAYFMKAVIPEAERMGIRLALHPNDPPMKQVGGVDCLITNIEDYRRAFRVAGSPALGMEFCCGCWLEGGKRGFGDIETGIREFVRDDRVLITHFRNVDTTMPVFTETFVDDGYADMFALMKLFCEEGYTGTMIYDHTPLMEEGSDRRAETAYAVGYIKALMEAAYKTI